MAMLFYWRAHEVILQSPLVEQRNIMGLKFAFCEREGETLRFLDAGLVFFCFSCNMYLVVISYQRKFGCQSSELRSFKMP